MKDLIKYTIGYSKGNLGRGYNEFMATLKPGQWGAITDIDFMLWSDQLPYIEKIVESLPQAGMFTCVTNRVGNLDQCYKKIISNNGEMKYHRQIALKLLKSKGTVVSKAKNLISGHLMIVKKETWDNYKFDNGILGVDNKYHTKLKKAGKPVYIMQGIYGFHYYRLLEGMEYKEHLKV